jgi:hypothetical protein
VAGPERPAHDWQLGDHLQSRRRRPSPLSGGQCQHVSYALSASYAPPGALGSLLLGQNTSFGGITLTQTYNNRGVAHTSVFDVCEPWGNCSVGRSAGWVLRLLHRSRRLSQEGGVGTRGAAVFRRVAPWNGRLREARSL